MLRVEVARLRIRCAVSLSAKTQFVSVNWCGCHSLGCVNKQLAEGVLSDYRSHISDFQQWGGGGREVLKGGGWLARHEIKKSFSCDIYFCCNLFQKLKKQNRKKTEEYYFHASIIIFASFAGLWGIRVMGGYDCGCPSGKFASSLRGSKCKSVSFALIVIGFHANVGQKETCLLFAIFILFWCSVAGIRLFWISIHKFHQTILFCHECQ